MNTTCPSPLVDSVARAAQPLRGAADDYDRLLELIGDASCVLLGEATHGSHEFYRERANITRRLITEKGFVAVAVEADWPDAWRVNRYVRGEGSDAGSEQALGGFKRFPTWMWRNTEMIALIDWLRRHNLALPPGRHPAGFYGLDLYSMFTSIDEVLRYLDQVDARAAQRARHRYACFDHYDADSQHYGYATGIALSASCEDAVVTQLQDMLDHAALYVAGDGQQAADAYFHARQNARLVANAEKYYRTMFRGRIASWNLRDSHMADTLDALMTHLGQATGAPAKVVVWEHNSHIGDARATEVSGRGEWSVGQLARERYGQRCRLIGLTTHHGSVTAATDWDGVAERKHVRPALPGSVEALFHDTGIGRFLLPLTPSSEVARALSQPRLERAIGVIYRPHTERHSHYFYARLPRQFDAVLHFDATCALRPLERGVRWEAGEAPETFPVGL